MLSKLRSLMKTGQQPIQAYIIHMGDPHNSEYLADFYKRIKFISNFSGSAGTVIITEDKALLWTDGRYFTQANKELDSNWTLMKAFIHPTPTEGNWLATNLPKGSSVGFDPTCITCTVWQNLHNDLDPKGISLVPLPCNLVDEVWGKDRLNASTSNPIKPLPMKYSGLKSGEKIKKVRQTMKEKGADVYVVTDLDDIAWLFNLRGSDIPYNPVFFSFVIITQDVVNFFVNLERFDVEHSDHFLNEDVGMQLYKYEDVYDFLSNLLKNDTTIEKVWLPTTANYRLYSLVPEKLRLCEPSVITATKAIKNSVEVENMIKSHIQDGVALCRYFSWLENELKNNRHVTETSGADQLQKFREETEDYVGLSFTTISSSGPNGAIIHYAPEEKTARKLTLDEVYLCDSGAQFYGGTTDVTRTMHFGTPTQMERECFTRVFKGQALLGMTVFPNKIEGNRLDSLARLALWKVGLDYAHGTGHGIGSYLNVHEGPMGISNKPFPNAPGIEENMFLSNEPGFYLEGKFGIRLENIERIVKAETPYNFMDRGYLKMETVTLCPIQTKMLIISELTQEEINYLNNYHRKCYETLGPILKEKGYDSAYEWLKRETQPI